jgi:hypothetical protein
VLHGFVYAGDVGDEPVADCGELEVCDQGVAVVVNGKVLGVEHVCPEFPALFERGVAFLAPNGFHVVFDGGGFGLCMAGCWEGDAVGGFDVAAAVDEFGVDGAGLRGVDGQGETGAEFAVIGGERCVPYEEAVPDGDALFGENAGQRGDGGGLWFGRPVLTPFARVDSEQHRRGRSVAGEVACDSSGIRKLLPGLAGEVDPEGGTDAVVVQRDADEAFLGPEAEGVPDKTEDIRWCFDRELFHNPVSFTLVIAVLPRLLVVGVVLVGDHPLG